jgi:dTDP-glucose 4,6-dehydratase
MPVKQKILVTGGAGFIGSEFVRQLAIAQKPVTVIDAITYAGDRHRLRSAKGAYTFHAVDIGNSRRLNNVFQREKPHTVVHFAAETHVDRSLQDVAPFIRANIEGTQNLIQASLKHNIKKFVHISTDEIYGQSEKGRFKETAAINPRNPYSATKASAEMLVQSAIHTYKLPGLIIRPANNYGPWQYPEKLIPVVILKATQNRPVPVYGRGEQIREWLHVSDCCAAIRRIMQKGQLGEIYNIGTHFEKNNLTTVKTILSILNKPHSLIAFVKDRPGHDFRYSVNYSKLKALGWRSHISFHQGIKQTIEWYQEHMDWMTSKLEFLEKYWKKVYKS